MVEISNIQNISTQFNSGHADDRELVPGYTSIYQDKKNYCNDVAKPLALEDLERAFKLIEENRQTTPTYIISQNQYKKLFKFTKLNGGMRPSRWEEWETILFTNPNPRN